VLTDSEGNEYSLIDQAPDTARTPNPEARPDASRTRWQDQRRVSKLTPRERLVFELKHYRD